MLKKVASGASCVPFNHSNLGAHEGDVLEAAATRCSGVACCVMVADCLPTLPAHAAGHAVAAAHTGLQDPTLLLSRGYSITLHNGRAVRDPLALKAGDEIETRLEKGTIKSIIK